LSCPFIGIYLLTRSQFFPQIFYLVTETSHRLGVSLPAIAKALYRLNKHKFN